MGTGSGNGAGCCLSECKRKVGDSGGGAMLDREDDALILQIGRRCEATRGETSGTSISNRSLLIEKDNAMET